MPDEPQTRLPSLHERRQLCEAVAKAVLFLDEFNLGLAASAFASERKAFVILHQFARCSFVFDFKDDQRVSIWRIGPRHEPANRPAHDWERQLEHFRQWLDQVRDKCEERNAADGDRVAAEAGKEHERFLGYQGDSYLTDFWIQQGLPAEEAEAAAQDRFLLCARLEFDGLEQILKDRYARQALADALTEPDKGVLFRLSKYTQQAAPESRRRKAINCTSKVCTTTSLSTLFLWSTDSIGYLALVRAPCPAHLHGRGKGLVSFQSPSISSRIFSAALTGSPTSGGGLKIGRPTTI